MRLWFKHPDYSWAYALGNAAVILVICSILLFFEPTRDVGGVGVVATPVGLAILWWRLRTVPLDECQERATGRWDVVDKAKPGSKLLAKVAITLMVVGAVWVALIVPITHSQVWAQPGMFACVAGVFLLLWWIAGGRR